MKLNMIDIEFYGCKDVVDAWRLYNSHLNDQIAETGIEVWHSKSNSLKVILY